MSVKHPLLRPVAVALLAAAALLPLNTSCGTLFFQDRHGQDPGRIDPNIVILDAVGLIFYLIPGIVAFGLDFYTGAIYLPPGVERGEGPFIRDKTPSSDAPEEAEEE